MSILVPEHNCWRMESAARVAFLIDGDAYFRAFMKAASAAEHSIYIIGWDINGRAQLQPDDGAEGPPRELGLFLRDVLSRRSDLHMYLLGWDFSMVYAMERDLLPLFSTGWIKHPRLHYKLDGQHPFIACHHQKIVVVDDALAFVGGIDFAKERWDTPEHLEDDARRRDTAGHAYAPFHDVQVAVDGQAALALGELSRERWRRATGEELAGARSGPDPWPQDLAPDLRNVRVAIARTEPEYQNREEVREVEKLYLDAIAGARHSIYIENQYLTSAAVSDALAARLDEEAGPEVILVLPYECSGWLEQSTMGVLRARSLNQLKKADRFDRLGVYYPVAEGDRGQPVRVHSKVLVVDERLVRVGSSNLSNRSMGVDTECDLAIESEGDSKVEEAIRGFRTELLAEHLGANAEALTEMGRNKWSLLSTIEKIRISTNRLRPLEPDTPAWVESLAPDRQVVDPEKPMPPEQLVESFLDENVEETVRNPWLRAITVLVVLIALASAWRFTPLHEWLSLDNLTHWAGLLQQHRLAPLLVIGAYVAGTLVMVPVTALIVVTALTFDPLVATIYALSGGVAAGVVTFGLGKLVGRDTVRRLTGSRLNRISRHLGRKGLLATFALRVAPVAPFTIINLVAGASHIRFRDFTIGTLLGLAPGVVAITVFETRLEDVIRSPGWGSWAVLALALLVIVAVFAWLRRHFVGQIERAGDAV